MGTIPLALWLGGMFGAQGVLVGQALGGVVFGLLAAWLALRAIANPAVARRGPVRAAEPEVAPEAVPGERRA